MLRFKRWVYKIFIDRCPGISYRYHQYHDGSSGMHKIISWIYLLWLNFCYYILFCHFLNKIPGVPYYEEHYLNIKSSESEAYIKDYPEINIDKYLEKIKNYDIISFDIFDTLIFRPLSLSTDLFYLVGTSCCTLNFKNIRIWAEGDARIKRNQKFGDMEVNLYEIWKNIEEDTGLSAKDGAAIEADIEQKLCYANPFMLELWNRLKSMGKKLIIVSDMYLPQDIITKILHNAGYYGADKIYISSEYRLSKAAGSLFHEVIQDFYHIDTNHTKIISGHNLLDKKTLPNTNKNNFSIVHIGDNPHSDQNMARGYGIDILPYQNVNKNVALYRPMDMSYIIGSAYRAIISNHLYNGLHTYSLEYEYGFAYGGLFVLGYCKFIHDYYENNNLDKLLFLSRDGDILKQVYDYLYPSDNTEYVYWSRKSATKLMANEDKHDFFRRFIYHKVNQGYTISEILHSMELDKLIDQLSDWHDIWLEREKQQEANSRILAYKQLHESEHSKEEKASIEKLLEKNFSTEELTRLRKQHFIDLKPDDLLTDQNGYLLRRFIEAKWDKVLEIYSVQMTAAKKYYSAVLNQCHKTAAIDIGWAGSGALALSHLVETVWKIPCNINGIIAGTNTIYNDEPDASEPFLQNQKLVSYLYSQQHNRDLLKKHDPRKNYNIFWELLLSSPTPHFEGFYNGHKRSQNRNETNTYINNLDITLSFGKYDENQIGIKDIQQGILDFTHEYNQHFHDFPYMFNISGRDAYAPMLIAASHNEKYLKMIEKKFNLEIGV